jgi:hypothetical protein
MFGEQHDQTSGRLFEFDVLGAPITKSAWYKRAGELGAAKNGYLSYEKSVQLAREFQRDDPVNPSQNFVKDLRLAIIEKMMDRGYLARGNEDHVKFFSALGTPLDIFHGIDAFVEFADGVNGSHIVTLDETTDHEKMLSGHKAQILFSPPSDAVEDEAAYLHDIDQLANDAVKIFEKDLS